MDFLKNVPTNPAVLKDLIPYRENRVISKSLTKSDAIQMMLMSVALGEEVTSERYPGDMLYYVLDGTMPLMKDGVTHILKEGECMAVEAGADHAIGGAGAFKILQVTVTVR